VPYYRQVGELPRKRHSQFRKPDGGLYAEELMGEEGFTSESALLYHRNLPTAIVKAEEVSAPPQAEATANRPLLPRLLHTHGLTEGGDLVTGRHLLLRNDDVALSYVAATEASTYYRNAIGDECVYVEAGGGRLESPYGPLDVGSGDYVVVPRSSTHRWLPRGEEPLRVLVVEAGGHIRMPERYLSPAGQLLERAPYSERDLRAPTEVSQVENEPTPVLVRHQSGLTRYTYANHPCDVVGWDGCLYPYALSIHDFEPLVKRFHAPPPVHQTFEGPGFVLCSFCPRPFDFDPQAVPVPYNHANVDSDEVLFYVGGNFMSRKGAGIGLGSMSLHPAGFVHGPQPGSVEASLASAGTDELAVMIDTFRPLDLGSAARDCEDPEYAYTWARGLDRVDAEDLNHPGLSQ
jgi:homogentisate 1,2-dioxygenase